MAQMLSLSETFKNAKKRESGAASPKGNMVVKVKELGDKSFNVEVMTGPAAGQVIDIVPGGKTTMAEYKKKGHKAETHVGGFLRVEGVRKGEDNVYNCRWMKSFVGMPSERHKVLQNEMSSFLYIEKDGKPLGFVSTLDIEGQSVAASTNELTDQIAAALESHKAVNIFGMQDGNFIQMNLRLRVQRKDGEEISEDPKARAADFVAGLADPEMLDAALAETPLSVVPTRTYLLGKTTAENLKTDLDDDKRISTVDPESFKRVSIGTRLAWALNSTREDAIAKEHSDLLIEDFLESAPTAAVDAFKKNGFYGVSDTHLTDYLTSRGVEVKQHPDTGWSSQSIALMRHEDSETDFFVVKSFATGAAHPYPPVKALEDARKAYATEMFDVARAAIESIQNGVSNTAKAETKAEEPSKKAAAKEEAKAEAETQTPDDAEADDSVKNMLDELANIDMEL